MEEEVRVSSSRATDPPVIPSDPKRGEGESRDPRAPRRPVFRIGDQLKENVMSAVDSLAAAKGRSALTVLGVVIGVSTVMAMATIVSGIRDQIVSTIEIAGPTTFYVVKVFSQTPLNPA